MEHIFSLYHVRPLDDEIEEVKGIGLFHSKQAAEDCIESYKKLPGFKDFPEGFVIVKERINKIYWQQGFKLRKGIQIKRFSDWKNE